MKLDYQRILNRARDRYDQAVEGRRARGHAGDDREFYDLPLASQVGKVLVELCEEFNNEFEKALEQASTEMLERASVMLAERAAEKEKAERG